MAEALSRVVPDSDRRMILSLRHIQLVFRKNKLDDRLTILQAYARRVVRPSNRSSIGGLDEDTWLEFSGTFAAYLACSFLGKALSPETSDRWLLAFWDIRSSDPKFAIRYLSLRLDLLQVEVNHLEWLLRT
jgi:hypothetical protein